MTILNFIKQCANFLWEFYLDSDVTLSNEEFRRLEKHKYAATDSSWLDELCMKRFWNEIVQFYPLWLAPNLITFSGFLINLATTLVLSSYCYSCTEEAPSWAYFQAALGMFLFQTLDATDGKQARRTNSSSVLGELFDHGCDSVSEGFILLNVCYAMQLGDTRYFVFLLIMGGIITFYCAHWCTYSTGKMRFARFDVTEAQLTIILVLLITGIFGPGLWNILIFGIPFKFLALMGSLIGSLWQIDSYMTGIFCQGAGKHGSTIAGTSVLSPFPPLIIVCSSFTWIYAAPTNVFDQHSTLFAMCFIAVAAKCTIRLVIAHMSKSPLRWWDPIYMAPVMFYLNRNYGWNYDEFWILLFATVYAYASLSIFCWKICEQLCWYFDLEVFSICCQKKVERKEKLLGSATKMKALNRTF